MCQLKVRKIGDCLRRIDLAPRTWRVGSTRLTVTFENDDATLPSLHVDHLRLLIQAVTASHRMTQRCYSPIPWAGMAQG